MSDSLLTFHQHSAGLLFTMAKQAAKRAFAYKGKLGEEVEVATVIVLCAVVAEAAINEVGQWFEHNRQRPPFQIPHSLPHGFYDMELRAKWSLLPIFLRQRTFDHGAEPWQSFEALVELRNYIVHLRRRSVSRRVASYLAIKSDGKLKFEAAVWACETMSKMFEKLTELIDPPSPHAGLWLWSPAHSFAFGLSTPGDPWPPMPEEAESE